MHYDPDSFPVGTPIVYCGEIVQIDGIRHERRQRSIMWHGQHIWILTATIKLADTVSNR